MVEARRCQSCGMYDAPVVPVPKEQRIWTSLKGEGDRKFLVTAYRCLGCAALDTIRRDFDKANEKHKPAPGSMAPGDGMRMVADDYHDEGGGHHRDP